MSNLVKVICVATPGALGACTLAHSSMIVFDWAKAGTAQNKIADIDREIIPTNRFERSFLDFKFATGFFFFILSKLSTRAPWSDRRQQFINARKFFSEPTLTNGLVNTPCWVFL